MRELSGRLRRAAALRRERRLDEALEVSAAALAAHPRSVAALRQRVNLCIDAGREDEALETCGRLLAIEPADAEAAGAMAKLLEVRGRVAEAHRALRPALGEGPVQPRHALLFARICRLLEPPSAEALPFLERALRDPALAPAERVAGLRELGQLHDALGSAREAFGCFAEANRLAGVDRRQLAALLDYMSRQPRLFSAQRLSRLPRARHGSELPVFIVGMPRSGTSLAEQILASHPAVFGAGELTAIGRVSLLHKQAAPSYAAWLERLDQAALDALAGRYLAELRALAPGAERVTDKMPFNFLHLGLIELLLPQARVVHCVRHPLDTCLSCFCNGFADAYPFTRDLRAAGEYYRGYAQLMAHWRATLALPVHTLSYEKLVAAPEPAIRELVAFCGLPWDDACLRFYASARKVSTPSYHQVRKPIYARSAGRHHAYAEHLGPLREALGEALAAQAEAVA